MTNLTQTSPSRADFEHDLAKLLESYWGSDNPRLDTVEAYLRNLHAEAERDARFVEAVREIVSSDLRCHSYYRCLCIESIRETHERIYDRPCEPQSQEDGK